MTDIKSVKLKKEAKQFAAFMTEVAEAMKKHGVENMVCVFGLNKKIRNTYIPLGKKEEHLYCFISDAVDVCLNYEIHNHDRT